MASTGPRKDALLSFHTTRWSIVLSAGRPSHPDSQAALEQLCRDYWYPLYAYARRKGDSHAEAQDLTQGFFVRLLEKNILEAADPDRGRFRAFLLTAYKRFRANEWNRSQSQRRGGAHRVLSIDFETGESRYSLEPADPSTPDSLYELEWALTLLGRVLTRLSEEFAEKRRAQEFELLKGFLTGRNEHGTYADVAARLGTSENAARVAAHRLRNRYRELIRSEIAQTVSDASEIEAEIQHLFDALSS